LILIFKSSLVAFHDLKEEKAKEQTRAAAKQKREAAHPLRSQGP
jgi:hypothetical protein